MPTLPKDIGIADLFSDYYDQAKNLGQRADFVRILFESLCKDNKEIIRKIKKAGETCLD